MKQTGLTIALFLLTAVHLFGGTYGGGIGTPSNPYLLYLPQHLTDLSQTPGDWTTYFRLTDNIDMSGHVFTTLGESNTPVQFDLDGQDHVIGNLPCAFISYGSLVRIRNLSLVNVSSQIAGALMANASNCTVENCRVIANVTCTNHNVGGLIGYAYNSQITNCSSAGIVTGGQQTQRLGGLIGHVELGTVSGCSSAASVTGGNNSHYVGGLIGMLEKAVLTGSWSSGKITAPKYVGGVVGLATADLPYILTITDCLSTASVNVMQGQFGSSSAGGLIGAITGNGAAVTRCHSMGPVSSSVVCSDLGGLIGSVMFSDVIECGSDSAVTVPGNSSNIGGLIGRQTAALVERCFSSGPVTGPASWYVGGLTGMQMEGTSVTRDCCSTSSVSGYTRVGGLIGYAGNDAVGKIERCFAAGQVQGTDGYIGGLIGFSKVTVSGSFYDKEATVLTTSAAGKGKTTAEMQNPLTFTSAGWDFEGETANGSNDYWRMSGYPMLSWQPRIDAQGDFAISLARGQQGQVTFDIVSLTGESLNWTLTGSQAYPWMTQVAPASGTTGNAVSVHISTADLECVDYTGALTITADNGDSIKVIIKVSVYEPVGPVQFADLSAHWQQAPCDWGQPCKAADWFVDGSIDLQDLLLLADSWLGDRLEPAYPVTADTFESGDFATLNWQHAGNVTWTLSSGAYEGSFCAKSGDVSDNQNSQLVLTCDLTGYDVDVISFAVKISSENGYDYLRFTIDDQPVQSWTGTANWSVQTFAVTPGVHTFKWTYTKDSDGSAGDDCGWIDNVRIYKMQ